MDKEGALFVLKSGIRMIKDVTRNWQPNQGPRNAEAELLVGLQLLSEALALALGDSTKAHAPIAFDRAYRHLFEITQRKDTSTYLVYIASSCSSLSGALKLLFFSKSPS